MLIEYRINYLAGAGRILFPDIKDTDRKLYIPATLDETPGATIVRRGDRSASDIPHTARESSNSPMVRSASLRVRSTSPMVRSRSLRVRSTSLRVRSTSPMIRSRSLRVRSKSLRVRSTSLRVRSNSLRVRSICPKVRSSSLMVRSDSLTVRSSSLRVRSSCPRHFSPFNHRRVNNQGFSKRHETNMKIIKIRIRGEHR